MSIILTCSKCTTQIPCDSLDGMCPKCLMALGFDSDLDKFAKNIGQNATWTFVPPNLEELATHFSDFEIQELVGHGGMGAVYKARHLRLDRTVALKILPTEFCTDAVLSERFLREARAMAKISHPNIVLLFDFGEANGVPFLCMPLPSIGICRRRRLERACGKSCRISTTLFDGARG